MIDEKELSKLITVTEAARLMDITPGAVRYLCRAGRVPGAQVVGRIWMIEPRALTQVHRAKPGRKAQT